MNNQNKIFASVRLLDVPLSLDKTYVYYITQEVDEAEVGAFVTVPFGTSNRKTAGVITGISSKCDFDTSRVKPLFSVSPAGAVLDENAMGLCSFLCSYTLCTFGEAVRAVIPSAAIGKMNETYSVNPDKELPARTKLPDKALIIYNYIKVHDTVRSGTLRTEFGDDIYDMMAALVKAKLVLRELTVTENTNIRYISYVSPTGKTAVIRSPIQNGIMDILGKTGKITEEELFVRLGRTAVPQLSALEKKGLISREKVQTFRNPFLSDRSDRDDTAELSPEQAEAFKKIDSVYSQGKAAAVLLHGVTGSGKTRVIKAVIDRAVSDGKGVIMLVPEISLTPQTVSYFCGCYGERVSVIHSGLSKGERFDSWKRIRDGLSDIVIGTRSAIFAPVKNLGLIIIDEEQEHTYKSDTDPKYTAHDVARYRCGKTDAMLLLSSATPSVNTYHKAVNGIYTLVEMTERYGGAELPEVIISDTRSDEQSGNLSPVGEILADKLRETYNGKKQSIVFLNRRGYNNAVICRICGEVIRCPSCSVSLTYHTKYPLGSAVLPEDFHKIRMERGVLSCHYCGFTEKVPQKCPVCSAEHFRFIGCGTQRAEEELSKTVPGAKILRMDADTTSKKNSHRDILDKFRRGKADILLGTQMVTKGHDFPNVTLVGVLNADSSLYLGDYRAAEKTFSMLTQVIGRAGRARDRGVAVVQTSNPDSEVIRLAAAQDYRTFFEKEIKLRHALTFPPFCDIAVISVSSSDESLLSAAATQLSLRLKKKLSEEFSDVGAIVFGPFEAPVYKVQNICRMRIIIKCRLTKRTRELIRGLICEFSSTGNKNLTISADLNPSSL